jgi:hypothetical protein
VSPDISAAALTVRAGQCDIRGMTGCLVLVVSHHYAARTVTITIYARVQSGFDL